MILRTLLSFYHLGQSLRLALRLLFNRRVPFYLKLIPILAAIYVVLPRDLLPDIIPVVGRLDDILVMYLSLFLFLKLASKYRGKDHPDRVGGSSSNTGAGSSKDTSENEVVEGSYRFVDD